MTCISYQRHDTLARWIGLAAMLGLLALMRIKAADGATTQPVQAVSRIGMTVEDLDRSIAFYTGVLSFTKTDDRETTDPAFGRLHNLFGSRARIVRLRLGEEELELTQFLVPEGKPYPSDSRSNDRWFQHAAIITSDMDRAYSVLREHKVRYASTAPQTLPTWNTKASGIRAFYFRDPDGHVLETLQFPPDKGRPQWHATDRLFLGIDHTAIVVADTDASVRFYRDQLGMRIAGESENWGDEQEHLNNVFGAHLRITTLRAADGPGIELLEYLAPRDGKPYPSDARDNDLIHWETVIRTPDSVDRITHDPDGHAVHMASN